MSDILYSECRCNHCSGVIKFETARASDRVECPHCHLETVLYIAPIKAVQSKPATSSPGGQKAPADVAIESLRYIGFLFLVLGLIGGLVGVWGLWTTLTQRTGYEVLWIGEILACGIIGTALNALFKFMAQTIQSKNPGSNQASQ